MLVIVAVVVGAMGCRDMADARTVPNAARPLRGAVLTGRLTARDLVEASGVVRSTRESNVFWSQNDSGNDERLFAYDSTGKALGRVRVAGAKNRDWEAIALGPCPTGSCLYMGDVGDNMARQTTVRLWRIPEPLSTDTVTPTAERLDFRYADAAQDVEAMWIGADSSVYLVSKRPTRDSQSRLRPARLYRLSAVATMSWRDTTVATATFVDTVPIIPKTGDQRSWITDAAMSTPDSAGKRRIAIRSNGSVFIFHTDASQSRPAALVAECSLSALKGTGGEGVAWLPDGRLLFNNEGSRARLHMGWCP